MAIHVGAAMGASWALNNPTYVYMNSWFHYAKLYAATAGSIGFMMLKYKWSIGKTQWFKCFPFVIVAINILIAVASDFESAIRGAMAMKEYGDRWWLSSENVWLYGGWWNWVNGIAGILNMHQTARVLARFWIQPPLFHRAAATVGASSRARPQYQAWVGRFR